MSGDGNEQSTPSASDKQAATLAWIQKHQLPTGSGGPADPTGSAAPLPPLNQPLPSPPTGATAGLDEAGLRQRYQEIDAEIDDWSKQLDDEAIDTDPYLEQLRDDLEDVDTKVDDGDLTDANTLLQQVEQLRQTAAANVARALQLTQHRNDIYEELDAREAPGAEAYVARCRRDLEKVDDEINAANLDAAERILDGCPDVAAIAEEVAAYQQQTFDNLDQGLNGLAAAGGDYGDIVSQLDGTRFQLDQLGDMRFDDDIKNAFHDLVEGQLANAQLPEMGGGWNIDGVTITASKPVVAISNSKLKRCVGQPCHFNLKGSGHGFEGGLIGFYAKVRAELTDPNAAAAGWHVRFVQNCNSDRKAYYDNGATVSRGFGFVRDVEPDPTPLTMGQTAVIRLTDAPKWQWYDHRDDVKLDRVEIEDQFKVYLLVKSPAQAGEIALYRVDWKFTGSKANSTYTIQRVDRRNGDDSGGVKLTGDFANNMGQDEYNP